MKSRLITSLALALLCFTAVNSVQAEGTVTLSCSEYDVLLEMLESLPEIPCPSCPTTERRHTIEVEFEDGPSDRGFDCSYQETAGADVWKCKFQVPTGPGTEGECIARYSEQGPQQFGPPVVTGGSHCQNANPPSGISPSSIQNSPNIQAKKAEALEKAKKLCDCKKDCEIKECETAKGYPKIDTGEGIGGITGMSYQPPGFAKTILKVAVKNKCKGRCENPKAVNYSVPGDPGNGCDGSKPEQTVGQ